MAVVDHHDREFIGADARDEVGGPKTFPQDPRRGQDCVVPFGFSENIVDVLQPIQSREENKKTFFGAQSRFQMLVGQR